MTLKDYRWSGYGEAMADRKRAKRGLRFPVTALPRGHEESPGKSMEVYRRHLSLEGDERRETLGSGGRLVRGALKAEDVAKVLTAKARNCHGGVKSRGTTGHAAIPA